MVRRFEDFYERLVLDIAPGVPGEITPRQAGGYVRMYQRDGEGNA
jgi:hypothetical protein